MSLGPLAASFILLITSELFFKAKQRVVVSMTKNFAFECLSVISGHIAALCGSELVTAAMVP